MIKRKLITKIVLSSSILFTLLLVCLFPKDKTNYTFKQKLTYIDTASKSVIYLLDSYNYLARTKVAVSKTTIEENVKELIEILIKDDKNENKIPSGFKSVLPSDTKLLSVEYIEGLVKLNFSKELINVDLYQEEKVLESIIYTVTSIENVNKVIIYIEGELLRKLKSGKWLPEILDRSYGINKEYDLESYKDINSVTVYYIGKYNDQTYYVPVTKYINDDREKIKIIIEELTSGSLYRSNLMSYLNSNTKLLATKQELDSMMLVFNEYIFSDIDSKNIIEEVIHSISLSTFDSYDLKEVIFKYNEQEIYKSVIKTIE